MSSSKPFFVSKPRAFMMFHTIGLNTGSVRLETRIRGLSWADDAVAPTMATTQAAISAGTRRRDSANITALPRCSLVVADGLVRHGSQDRRPALRFTSTAARRVLLDFGNGKSLGGRPLM